MKFSDFVADDAIRATVVADSKEGVIREMTQSLVDAGKISAAEFESIVKAIMKREDLGSTGIGRGVAVPHTKHPSVDRLVGAVAVSPKGIQFESLDVSFFCSSRLRIDRATICGHWKIFRGSCEMSRFVNY
jgi:PTS system fructose-specific IIA component/PTS system nitrogen regulatory IIA component